MLCKEDASHYRVSCNRSRVSYTSRVSNRSRGLRLNILELMVLVRRSVVRCILYDVLLYSEVYCYVIVAPESSKKLKKSHTIKLKFEAVEPGGSNRSRVSNTSRVSNRSRGSDSIVLIQAGDFS